MPAHPDPTFHASAKLAMQAPPEKLAYTVMLADAASQAFRRLRRIRQTGLADVHGAMRKSR